MKTRTWTQALVLASAASILVLAPSVARAQNPAVPDPVLAPVPLPVPVPEADHLKCYEVLADNNQPDPTNLSLWGPQFQVGERCRINRKAAFLCVDVIKRAVDGHPTGGNDPRGGPAGDYLCYRTKCNDAPIRSLKVDDQFDNVENRQIRIEEARLVCAPVRKALIHTAD